MSITKALNLTELLVNPENYRFEGIGGQKEAIEAMIKDQGERLFKLAEHIAHNGLNPNDKIQVAPSSADKGRYIVLEGNRRVVSLKIANHPDLIDIDGFSSLKKKFKKLHDEYKLKLVKEVECTVYEDPSEADKWIKLKHTGENDGVGTVRWDAQQVQRFEEKVEGKSSVVLQAVKLLHASPDVAAEVKNRLGELKITNLDRLISDPDVRQFLGIEIQGGQIQSEVDKKEVVKGLTQIARDLLDPKFKVTKIYTKQDRMKYLKEFSRTHKPDVTAKAQRPWQFAGTHGGAFQKTSSKRASSRERKALIPKMCVFKIDNPKVNKICDELRKLQVEDYKNAVAVLFRVFIELSMDCFIDAKKLPKVNIDSKLRVKVEEVANYLENNNLANKHVCKGIRHAVNNKNDVLGIDTWNAYVHNPKFSPTPRDLMTAWDNIQEFMEKVWEPTE